MMRPTIGAATLRGMRWRLSLHRERAVPDPAPVPEPQPRSRLDSIQERQLSSVFEPPRWLRDPITGDVVFSLRRYFVGVTIVAAFNAVVVGVGALLLDVPPAGTIAVVTLVTAYVPFIGAFVSGAFAVVLALGAAARRQFGMFGLILAAPLVSAGIHIVRDIGEIRTPARTPADAGPSRPVPA